MLYPVHLTMSVIQTHNFRSDGQQLHYIMDMSYVNQFQSIHSIDFGLFILLHQLVGSKLSYFAPTCQHARMASTWMENSPTSFYTRIWRVDERRFPTLDLEYIVDMSYLDPQYTVDMSYLDSQYIVDMSYLDSQYIVEMSYLDSQYIVEMSYLDPHYKL